MTSAGGGRNMERTDTEERPMAERERHYWFRRIIGRDSDVNEALEKAALEGWTVHTVTPMTNGGGVTVLFEKRAY